MWKWVTLIATNYALLIDNALCLNNILEKECIFVPTIEGLFVLTEDTNISRSIRTGCRRVYIGKRTLQSTNNRFFVPTNILIKRAYVFFTIISITIIKTYELRENSWNYQEWTFSVKHERELRYQQETQLLLYYLSWNLLLTYFSSDTVKIVYNSVSKQEGKVGYRILQHPVKWQNSNNHRRRIGLGFCGFLSSSLQRYFCTYAVTWTSQ